MEQFRIRHINIAEQRPLRILSLDGGGVRGYSMLLLLQEVMHKLFVEIEGRAPEKWEVPRPCDHFDLIGGTGTGGLIAILLGRLRLDVATALEIYVDMTRFIFEEVKTVGGIPYGKTLYKASRLEEATKEVVSKYESLDTADQRKRAQSPGSMTSWTPSARRARRSHTLPSLILPSASSSPALSGDSRQWAPQFIDVQTGEGALWYDERPGRCKTFVTAVYKGSDPGSPPAILRTYESASESCPVGNLSTIWEASRATCAVFPAFKPIQIGQSVFMDEGQGTFSPALLVLEEAIVNEWPEREIGVFVSIGSGKLPANLESPQIGTDKKPSTSLRDSIIGVTPLQKFVEARENHKAKIGECEQVHLDAMKRLRACGISEDIYFRLNVDEGVGDKGMAEWARLADISNGTRAYLAKPAVQRMNKSAASKLAGIWRMRWEGRSRTVPSRISASILSAEITKGAPLPRHYASQPIVPNLASEFGRLNPPYILPRSYSGPVLTTTTSTASTPPATATSLPIASPSCSTTNVATPPPNPTSPNPLHTTIVTRRPPPQPIQIFTQPRAKSSHSTTASTSTSTSTKTTSSSNSTTTTTTTTAPLAARLPLNHPRVCPLTTPSILGLPLYEPTSARITDFGHVELDFPVPERLPSLDSGSSSTPSTASTTNGLGLGLALDLHRAEFGRRSSSLEVRREGEGEGEGDKDVKGDKVDKVDKEDEGGEGEGAVKEGESGEDEEVALHFRELKRIQGKIEREAKWVEKRGYFNA